MSNDQNVLVSLEQYGMDFSISLSLGIFSALICMVGLNIDSGPGQVEKVREGVLAKVKLSNDLLLAHPELREEEGFYKEYYLTLCVLLVALDAYLQGNTLNINSVLELMAPMKSADASVNPNFEKFFH